MAFSIDPVWLIYGFAAGSAILFAEGCYLLFYSTATYRKRINRRLSLLQNDGNRENILVQLRRERGLDASGQFRLPIESLNRLITQAGVSMGPSRIALLTVISMPVLFAGLVTLRGSVLEASAATLVGGLFGPILILKMLRSRRQKAFGAQFPDAIDMIVRSLRAGHPVPIAVNMVGREMKDPVGSEFGIVGDEITYGADLETAMRNLYFRMGQEDLPLFVTAVAIQGSTGGNLGEILENLSGVIRQRFKMRRKIKALAAEARASALILSSLPIGVFAIIQLVSPQFYGSVWQYELTKMCLGLAIAWMLTGNLIMYRMVNFKI
ncbi:type II secretion system F family protein [Xanthobacteraceae bacterium Astr-EGSB]|uniref:type II secretion system F family protein n=1 Tax=Astrobacterium formosum TaxID=3069710 RepID=UPI0027B4EAC8|nr:type II secretion system F family protein [Xanthobacteraceae bacterium Astr-EGSB]